MLSEYDDLATRVQVRYARESDADDIARIDGDLHGGLDQLPALYTRHLKDPNRRARVCLIDGQIIAFQMAYIIDDGQTVIFQSLRLHPSLRKNGLWPQIRAKLSQPFPHFPHITRVVWATAVKKVYLQRMKKNRSNGMNYTMERPTVRLRPTKEDIRRLEFVSSIIPNHETQPTQISGKDAMVVLQNRPNQTFLFPHGRIILSWEPFRLIQSNLEIITNRYQTSEYSMYASQFNDNKQTNIIGDENVIGTGEVKSVSFGGAHEVPSGLRYDLDYYGNDVQDALSHIKTHLLNCLTNWKEGILSFEVFLPVTLDSEKLKSLIRERYNIFCSSTEMTFYLFESSNNLKSKL